jgi:outer membrane protein
MRIRYATSALAGLLLVPAAWAQTAAPAHAAGDAAAPSKIAVINVQVAITSTAEGKQASAELQSQFAPRNQELENMRKQIEELQNRLRTGATTLSDEEKARLSRQGDQLTRSFQRKQQEMQDDAQEAQQEVVNRIGRKMLEVLDRYSKENGYGVVIDVSAQNTPVIYNASQIDITQQIIKLYDQAYPVKSAATAAPAPAKPRPAAPKQPPQQ